MMRFGSRSAAATLLLAVAFLPGGGAEAATEAPVGPKAAIPSAPHGVAGASVSAIARLDLHPSFEEGAPTPVPVCAGAPSAPRAAPPTLPLLGLFPAVELRTALVALHLIGLCFGLGGSTLLYFWIVRWIRWGALPPEIVRTFDFVGKTVAVGLVLLWVSGLGFLACYEVWDPGKLINPKLWAKLVIVTALSLNGILVHGRVSPFVRASAAAPLLGRDTPGRRLFFIASGTVSGTSWYAAFALGLLHEFNGTVSMGPILLAWGMAMAAAVAGLSFVLSGGWGGPGPAAVRGCASLLGRWRGFAAGAGTST